MRETSGTFGEYLLVQCDRKTSLIATPTLIFPSRTFPRGPQSPRPNPNEPRGTGKRRSDNPAGVVFSKSRDRISKQQLSNLRFTEKIRSHSQLQPLSRHDRAPPRKKSQDYISEKLRYPLADPGLQTAHFASSLASSSGRLSTTVLHIPAC